LPRGVAIVSQSGWVEPILAGIDKSSGKYREIDNVSVNNIQSVAMPFVIAVFDQIDNELFVDKKIRDIMRDKNINSTQSDDLFRVYRRFVEQPLEVISNPLQKAKFAVSIIGCQGLIDVYPMKSESDSSFSQLYKSLNAWKEKLYKALDEYALFSSVDEKKSIVDSLLLIKANEEKNSASKQIGIYQKAIIAGLPEIFPIRIESGWEDEKIYHTYKKWREKLYVAFDEYAVFKTIDEKKRLADQLLFAKAKVPGVYKDVYDAWVRRAKKAKETSQG